jgi:Cof subfamily protein (haloacid dehalogenase superfamily)
MSALPYAVVFSDIDGTLLRPDHTLSSATRTAVRRTVEAGATFCLATGRMPSGTVELIRELGVPCARICYSGAYVLDANGREVSSSTIDGGIAAQVLEVIHGRWPQLEPCYFSRWNWFVEHPEAPAVLRESSIVRAHPQQASLSDLLEQGVYPNKIFCSRSQGIAASSEEIRDTLSDMFPQLRVIRSSSGLMIEIINANVSKASGARALLESMGIDPAHTLAFGDDENDVDLIRMAGCGVAVANAAQDVQDAANEVAPSNSDDGVARYLEERVLPQR